MLSFKHYLLEVVSPGLRAKIMGNIASSRASTQSSNFPNSFVSSPEQKKESDALNAERQKLLNTAKETRLAAEKATKRAETNTLVGAGLVRNLIGTAATKKQAGSGIFGVLANYDKARAERGVSFRTTPSMASRVRNFSLNLATPTENPSFTNTVLGNIGGAVRRGNILARGVERTFNPIKPPEQKTAPMSFTDMAKINLQRQLNTGEISAQQAGLSVTSTPNLAEPTPDESATFRAEREQSRTAAKERFTNELAARMKAIGDRPGFSRTRAAWLNPSTPSFAPQTQRPFMVGPNTTFQEE